MRPALVLALVVLSARLAGAESPDGGAPDVSDAEVDGGQPAGEPGADAPPPPAEPVVVSEPAPSPVTEPSEPAPAASSEAAAAPSEPMPAGEPEPAPSLGAPSAPAPSASSEAAAAPPEPVPASAPEPAIVAEEVLPAGNPEPVPAELRAEPADEPPPERTPAAPPAPPMNEFALEAGWNAPAGWGVRYMRQIEDTKWAVGAGFAPLTMWGLKLSFLARWAPSLWEGRFFQASLGLSTGVDEVEQTLTDAAGATSTATFRKTPGSTLDAVFGYRFGRTASFLDVFAGYSFNLKGTALQTGPTLQTVDQAARDGFDFQSPGGVVWGASYGWRF